MIFSFLITLGLIGLIIGLAYLFLVWNFDYWKKRGIKGPKPYPFYGSLPSMVTQKRNPGCDLRDIYNQYHKDEDFVGVYSIRTPELLILSPEFVHKVLVSEFKNFHDNESSTWMDEKREKIMAHNPFILTGEQWKERRQEITPGITINRIKAVYPVTQEVCGKLTKYIRNLCSKPDPNGFDAKDISLRFTSELVTDAVLGVKAESLSDNPTPILGMTKKLFDLSTVSATYFFISGLWPTIKKFYKVKFFQKDCEDFFLDLVGKSLDMRRHQKTDRLDFMNYMLQVQEKKKLANDELLSHIMTFLIDGFETSANVIAVCLYQLAKNPAEQEKLRTEILNSLNKNGELDFEYLEGPSYVDQCLNESIRLVPPIVVHKKLCTEPCVLTNRNGVKLQVNRNDIVLIPAYAIYYDPQYFPNPEEFQPDRFSEENGGVKKYRDMSVFFPFGDGPRICLGMKFALIQTKAAVAEIVRNFNIKLNPRTNKDNKLKANAFLGELDGGMWLDFEERN
ncbi:probable cytochrome P450 28d1 [Episyrphus balteatus]|uniref:probable cytochrome P450 28d1 n=1 Tax=Episyrphus balteatus TaxID=286459 RepID=UPI002484F28A|nr:probable cytochrome P450 28d1 [Episyrphus balteatus]